MGKVHVLNLLLDDFSVEIRLLERNTSGFSCGQTRCVVDGTGLQIRWITVRLIGKINLRTKILARFPNIIPNYI